MALGEPRRGTGRVLRWAVCLASFVVILPGTPPRAETESNQPPPRWHLFFGTDGAEQSMFGHAGFVWAPAGDLHHSGWRFKAIVSGGTFEYLAGARDITGQLLSAAILPGFQWLGPDAGVTVYAGATVQDQSTDPYDPGKPRQGTRFGAKAHVEGWVRAIDGVFLNASGSYATAAETYTARISANVEVAPRFAIEPEISFFGEPGYDQQRYGMLIEYRPSSRFALKVGGGWAIEPDDEGLYAAFQVKAWR